MKDSQKAVGPGTDILAAVLLYFIFAAFVTWLGSSSSLDEQRIFIWMIGTACGIAYGRRMKRLEIAHESMGEERRN